MSEQQPCVVCGKEEYVGDWLCQECWRKLPHPMKWVLNDSHLAMTNAIERWENQAQMCRDYLKAVGT